MKTSSSKLYELYRHFDIAERLLYVGMASRAVNRLAAHRSKGRWFDDIVTVRIERFPDKDSCRDAEIKAIKTEGPIYNKKHTDRRERAPKPTEPKFRRWLPLYTVARLSRDLKIKQATVSEWMEGKSQPSEKVKIKIVDLSNGVIQYADFFK